MSTWPRVCCVMASDAPFFYQTRASIETFDAVRRSVAADLKVISLGLEPEQTDWLNSLGVEIVTGVEDRAPRFRDGPLHTIAMTCRPYIPALFPGYEAYLWIDSDIRFLSPEGFMVYVRSLQQPRCSIVIAPETEPAYSINRLPEMAGIYHREKRARLREEFGEEVARYLEFTAMFNAGIFAARADSPLWPRYRRNLERVLRLPYNRMREQDAMLVSIVEVQDTVKVPSIANWLCSLRMPLRAAQAEGAVFVNPDDPAKQILVAHLTNSSEPLMMDGKPRTLYDWYRQVGLTA